MIPDNNSDNDHDFVWFGVKWTPGARRAVYAAIVALGGLWLGWDKVAQLLSSAHVWAIVAFIAMTCFSPVPAQAVSVHSPEATSHFMCVPSHYGQTKGFSQ